MTSSHDDRPLLWSKVRRTPVPALAGLLLSLVLLVWALAGGPGAEFVQWIALLPLALGVLGSVLTAAQDAPVAAVAPPAQAEPTPPPAESVAPPPPATPEPTRTTDMSAVRDVMLALGTTFDRRSIAQALVQALVEKLPADRALVLLNDEGHTLIFGAYSATLPNPEDQLLLEQLHVAWDNAEADPVLGPWARGEALVVDDPTPYIPSRLTWLLTTLNLRCFYGVPLRLNNGLAGALIVDNSRSDRPITPEQRMMIDVLAVYIATTLENARLYQLTDEQLSHKVRELEIITRIDRELNYALSVDHVLELTVDWVLRFTGSDVAAVGLVGPGGDEVQFEAGYGWDAEAWNRLRSEPWPADKGVTGRAVRTGKPQNVGDIAQDPDYLPLMPNARSELAVPVVHRDRVIAVIALLSRKPDAFNTDNVEFTLRLAARAAAAIDNARLFDQTLAEQRKLELVLSTTADAVVVVGLHGQLLLVNQAALASFQLSPKENYVGRSFDEVFAPTGLVPLFERARGVKHSTFEEITLPTNRTMHVSIVPAPGVGWSIAAHDITPLKETDQLKNELLATTSHDLKNPLASIMGYMDLIHMTNQLNPQGQEYARRVHQAVVHMRQLIDDLLDMARIESGITLRYRDVHLKTLVDDVMRRFHPLIREKQLAVEIDVPDDLSLIPADEARLNQIVSNLLSNAIKYTPPEGRIWIKAEAEGDQLEVSIRDTGLGISPEDQAQVFARFFRVRTPETERIEGTGLGLPIVKSLVEAHGGQVGLESRLGEGSTFYFTVPLEQPEGAIREDAE